MRHNRHRGHYGDRIAKIIRDSMESSFAQETGGRIKTFITDKPVLSTCLGLTAGIVLGMLIRRRD